MGLFDFLKKNNTRKEVGQPTGFGNETVAAPVTEFNGVPLLNLEKGQILDLNKYADNLKNVRASAGWKFNNRHGADFDLDLCAYLSDGKEIFQTVYYGKKGNRHDPIWLDGDDLKGSKKGNDNENIFVKLHELPRRTEEVYFAVVIYMAESKKQCFEPVRDAYMRLVDVDNGNKEICRFSLSENGGSNTAVLATKLFRKESGWSFEALGIYSCDSITSLMNKLPMK